METDPKNKTSFRFDRMELAGSLGDLGTLIPIAAGMILFNHLSATSVFIWVGLFYVLAGAYYRLPIPVQPLKVVGALAIAAPDKITEPMIAAAGVIFGLVLIGLSLSGAMPAIARVFTKPVIRGIQLGLGLILMKKGFALIASKNLFISGDPLVYAGLPVNLIAGIMIFMVVLLLLNNQRVPAALFAMVCGLIIGLAFGGLSSLGLSLGPEEIRFYIPGVSLDLDMETFWQALVLLVIPQIPLTIGNAAIGTADTACSLFPGNPNLERATPSRFALTMGLINLPAGMTGAMPMCHGAGGLAAHYRFGARTGGSNLMIGIVFIILALAFGKISLDLITLLPNAVLGVLLAYAGIELALLIRDVKEKSELFVVVMIAGIGLATTNMAWAFAAGILAEIIIRRAGIRV